MVWVYILIGVAVLLAALLGYAATKPNTFRIQRAASINAAPDRIFEEINDFHRWMDWSPWEKLDPALQRTFSGPQAGVGTIYEWEGNKKVGKGRMEILESSAPNRIVIKLDFIKPFEAHNTTEFTLQPNGNATNVNWAMLGQQPFMFKVMTVFMNLDKMIGKDFEAGLANLKGLVEK